MNWPGLTAKYADYAPTFPEQKRTTAQQAGLNYEAAVLRRLKSLHTRVEDHPWLYYKSPRASGVCQPDALVWLDEKHLLVVEVKLTWVRGARDKLLKFYGPILSVIYPDVEISYLQVYKNAKRGCHKRTVSLYELETIKPGAYKECHHIQ